MILKKLRKVNRSISLSFILIIVFQFTFPVTSLAMTGSSIQPEYTTFESANSTEMVNLFNGDFKYNIPLMDVGGYPINISYDANVSMDQEASWVGFGWNLNTGSLTRGLRGLPDDLNGEKVTQEYFAKDDVNSGKSQGIRVSFGVGATVPIPTVPGLSVSTSNQKRIEFSAGSLNNSNYSGKSVQGNFYYGAANSVGVFYGFAGFGVGASASSDMSLSLDYNGYTGMTMSMGASVGVGVNAGYQISGFGLGVGASATASGNISIQSRKGLVGLSANTGYNLSANMSIPLKRLPSSYGELGISTGSSTEHQLKVSNRAFMPSIRNSILHSGSSNKNLYFLSTNIGFDVPGLAGFSISGEFSFIQKNEFKQTSNFAFNKIDIPSYGVYYAQNAKREAGGYVLQDFNRINDAGVIDEKMYNLPFSILTYDMFSASAQGLNYAFSTSRNDIGTVFDNYSFTRSSKSGVYVREKSDGVSIDLNFKSIFKRRNNLKHLGIGIELNNTDGSTNYDGSSSFWITPSGNIGTDLFEFTDKDITWISYEPSFYKSTNDAIYDSKYWDNSFRDIDQVVSLKIENDENGFHIGNNLNSYISTLNRNYEVISQNFKKSKILQNTSRVKRSTFVEHLNVKDAKNYSLNFGNVSDYSNVTNLTLDGKNMLTGANKIKMDSDKMAYKVAEFSILNETGARYHFGLPVMSTNETEFMHSIPSNSVYSSLNESMLKMNSSIDKSSLRYYTSKKLPDYASNYLLTAITSTDYVDLKDDGLTSDDLGDFTKFNYSKKGNYKWRSAYGKNKSNGFLMPNSYSSNLDDMVSYSEGERNLWYIHSIETKEFIAKFILDYSLRKDGNDINGVKVPSLSKIELYSKSNLSTPIKIVKFKYDNSLCPGVPNSDQDNGKLTLKSIHFYTGESSELAFNPYTFEYHNSDVSYDNQKVDRWGNYTSIPSSNQREFPYTNQNKSFVDNDVKAWTLSKITLPSGGTISVDYESDDYSLVNDKLPNQMYMIVNKERLQSDKLDLYTNNEIHLRTYGDINTEELKNKLKKLPYRNGSYWMYFKGFVYLKNTSSKELLNYYVPIDIDNSYTENNICTIKLKTMPLGDKRLMAELGTEPKLNGIALYGFQQARNFYSEKVYGIGEGWKDAFNEFVAFFKGVNKRLMDMNVTRYLSIEESYVRLPMLENKKIGGGKRVKSITYSDEWSSMASGEKSLEVTQKYTYGEGVLNYEPNMGGDDIARNPEFYIESHKLAPDDLNYQETPHGDELYPSGIVGYKSVKVSNVYDEDADNHDKPGDTEYLFYTTADFPYKSYSTELQKELPNINVYSKTNGQSYLGDQYSTNFDYNISVAAMSQGYLVKTNNMHGQLKEIKQYDSEGRLVAGEKYNYKVSEISNNELDNKVPVLNKNNTITSDYILMVDVDVTNDSRSMVDKTFSSTSTHSQYIGIGNIIDVAIDIVKQAAVAAVTDSKFDWSDIGTINQSTFNNTTINDFKTNVLTKLVTQSGILISTESYDVVQNTKVIEENLVWDSETGSVLLNKITNHFYNDKALVSREGDSHYQFNYPAHWMDNKFGGTYQNQGIIFSSQILEQEFFSINQDPTIDALFLPGDEIVALNPDNTVVINSDNKPLSYWVVLDEATGSKKLIDRYGNFNDEMGDFNYKIVRSGAANMLSESMGGFISLNNPIVNYNNQVSFDFSKVLESHAQTYTDKAQMSISSPYTRSTYNQTISSFGNEVQYFLKFLDLLFDPTSADPMTIENASLYDKAVFPKSASLDHIGSSSNSSCKTINEFVDGKLAYYYEDQYKFFLYNSSSLPILYNTLITNPLNLYKTGVSSSQDFRVNPCLFSSLQFEKSTTASGKSTINLVIKNRTSNDLIPLGESCIQCTESNNLASWGYFKFSNPSLVNKLISNKSNVLTFSKPTLTHFDGSTLDNRIMVTCDGVTGYVDFVPVSYDAKNYKIWNSVVNSTYTVDEQNCNSKIGETVNPYKVGLKGRWHGEKAFVFNSSKRKVNALNSATNGVFTSFVPFWSYDNMSKTWKPNINKYQESGVTTIFDNNGHIRETKDLRNVFESVLMGYNNRLPIARASKAMLRDILSVNFEDYDNLLSCNTSGFMFNNGYLSDKESHSGRKSLRIQNLITSASRPIVANKQTKNVTYPYVLSQEDNVLHFSPIAGQSKKYKLSYWQKTKSKINSNWKVNPSNSSNLILKILVGNKNVISSISKGNVINGWQKIDVYFELNSELTSNNNSIQFYWGVDEAYSDVDPDDIISNDVFYIDDIRIQPVGSKMIAAVFDPLTYRKMADLDENNFAVFYEYDSNGSLVRVKRETLKGIVTVNESLNNLIKK